MKNKNEEFKEFKEIHTAPLEIVIECPNCKHRERFQPEGLFEALNSFCEEYGYDIHLKEDYLIAKAVLIRRLMTKAGHSLSEECKREMEIKELKMEIERLRTTIDLMHKKNK
jgi:hypothetical protein